MSSISKHEKGVTLVYKSNYVCSAELIACHLYNRVNYDVVKLDNAEMIYFARRNPTADEIVNLKANGVPTKNSQYRETKRIVSNKRKVPTE